MVRKEAWRFAVGSSTDHAGESGLNRKQAQQPKAAANAQSPDRGRMVEIPTEMMDRGGTIATTTQGHNRLGAENGQRIWPACDFLYSAQSGMTIIVCCHWLPGSLNNVRRSAPSSS